MKLFVNHRPPLTDHQRDQRDLDILALNDLELPWPEIAWITGTPIEIIETIIAESQEGEDAA